MDLDPVVSRRHNVEARCRNCGRRLLVNTIPDDAPAGATLQENDIPESRLKDLVCSECVRAARANGTSV